MRALSLLSILLCAASASADDRWRATAAEEAGDPRVELELLADRSSVAPGERFRVGVRFVLDPHWHVYFRNPGEAAIGTEVLYEAEGGEVGELRWPTPARLLDPSGTITTFGYEEAVLLGAAVAATGEGEVTVRASADFLVCKIDCIPGRVDLERTIPVGESVPSEALATFDETWSRLPRAVGDTDFEVAYAEPPEPIGPSASAELTIDVSGGALSAPTDPRAAFFPDRVRGVTLEVSEVRSRDDGATLVLSVTTGPDEQPDQRLCGIVNLVGDEGPVTLEIDLPLPRGPETAVVASVAAAPSTPPSFAWILLLAFVGGLILNAMPCVLPVLAIKVVALGQLAHQEGRARWQHVAAYTAGIVLSMLALAGVVLGLRAAGTEVGWGFQLQDPIFATVLAGALVVFAMGLFGVYALGVDAGSLGERVDRAHGLRRSVGEGVLAVVLATPCSAPFLGTAVGFAFAGSAATILGVFLAIGLGLALPFALVALVPGARRLVPRPGGWMEVLQRALGFLLLATAVWLLWLVGQLSGTDGMAQALAFLVALAAAVWMVARAQRRLVGVALAAALLVPAGLWAFPLPEPEPAATSADDAWSPEAVEATLADGQPVFVDFTADWCITCRANERLVLQSDAVRQAFEETGARLLVADWTRRDETIRQVLAEHGKAGVPLYLVYRPGETAPEVLPELLTEAIVTDALRRASARTNEHGEES
ncbi:MAG: thioredoxin family protein [Deltaproteobacteria bacterium]|nr:thioredoxin family protein [Deltaproteobacteria bacterium]